ncbi:MAG: TatD family hydrolase [Candidatus Peribacteraceae bacterium]|nr:TatD family hydrolase [Candidatus Peribacteraceae bacterium]
MTAPDDGRRPALYAPLVIDTHCHLASAKFDADRSEMVARARAAGVERLICIADSLPESEKCLALAKEFAYIFCTTGVHPHAAKDWDGQSLEQLRTLAQGEKVVAIGEIGLDYHYDFSPREKQKEAFVRQLELAAELKLPAVVHCREAVTDVRELLLASQARAVIHCCTETWDDVAPLVAAGHFLSFTGIATFPASTVIRNTIKQCPIEQLMIETDSPYLAPVPHRGKRNEPAFLPQVLQCVAEIKGLSVAEADKATTAAAQAFFGRQLA